MHLTGGQYKGIKILVPDSVKPTLSKVRESVFNMLLQFDLCDNSFLDMFCGSGIMSIEAVSRHYNVTSLEINRNNVNIIKNNFQKIRIKPNIILCDSLKYKTNEKYSIIYIDPPWDYDYKKIIFKAETLLNENGIIFVEYDKQREINIQEILDSNNSELKIFKEKKYGRCLISVLKKD